jgi:hypothetical protein
MDCEPMGQPTSPAEAMFFAINTAKFNGMTVTLVRGASATADVPANLGRSRLVVEDEAGARIEATSHDFIVRACDYAFDGQRSTPAEGDQVNRVVDGKTWVHELMTPPYDPHDHAGTLLRLHTKLVLVR